MDYSNGDFESIDPNLEEAAKEIEEILNKRAIAGSFALASSTHTRFFINLPEWSAIKLNDTPEGLALRIKSSSKEDGPEHLSSSAHLLLSMKDVVFVQAAFLDSLNNQIIAVLEDNGVELDHTPYFARSEGEAQ